jgi:hypothetical protein
MENFPCVSLSHQISVFFLGSIQTFSCCNLFPVFSQFIGFKMSGQFIPTFSYSCICRTLSSKEPLNKMLSREHWPCWFRAKWYCAGLMGQPRASSADIEGYRHNKPRAFVWYIWWSQSGRRKYYRVENKRSRDEKRIGYRRISLILHLFSYFCPDSDSNTDNTNNVG